MLDKALEVHSAMTGIKVEFVSIRRRGETRGTCAGCAMGLSDISCSWMASVSYQDPNGCLAVRQEVGIIYTGVLTVFA